VAEGGEQLIREIWRRWNAGERELDPEIMDPEIEVHSALASTIFSGEEGLGRWIAEIDEQFEAWELGVDAIEQMEPDRFLVDGSVRVRGRGSGMQLDQPASWLVDIEGGRLLRMKNFIGPEAAAQARAAAGSGE
jgi:hypothetical protein